MSKQNVGPGYASPLDAMKFGPQEKLVWVPCLRVGTGKPDYLATINVDPESADFCKVIHRLPMPYLNDELHHTGWNTCSSCFGDSKQTRDKLIMPCLESSRIYVVDVSTPTEPKLFKTIEPEVLKGQNASFPHTTHCLPDGVVMVSTMGDANGDGRGSLITFDPKTFECKGKWSETDTEFGYDYWYQPAWDVLIVSEWGSPNAFRKGFNPQDIADGKCGTHLNVFSWKDRRFLQRIDLGSDGVTPLEIRFLHDPLAQEGYVGCAYKGVIYRFFRKEDGTWDAEKVISIPVKKVEGWVIDEMAAAVTDIIISLDDRFLYFSDWFHGDIRQYDITDRSNPKFIGQVFIGGLITKEGPVKVVHDTELKEQPDTLYVKGKKVEGSAQMLQLSLDGKRLYVTTSLYSPWDRQFFPDMLKNGSMMLQVDVNTESGGLTLNQQFLVDFGSEPDGPALAHEIRYPGGDCTSDIWLAEGGCEC